MREACANSTLGQFADICYLVHTLSLFSDLAGQTQDHG